MKVFDKATPDKHLQDVINYLGIPNYVGAFLKDELPKRLKINHYIIVNLDNSDTGKQGAHWTLLSNLKCNDALTYFDSYGLPPPKEVVDIAKRMKKKLFYNDKQYQKLDSNYCGLWCIYMMHRQDIGDSFYDALYDIENTDGKFIPNYFEDL